MADELKVTAAKALSLLDLTDLTDTCDSAAIAKLCADARGSDGAVAAICIWPRFVAEARSILGSDSEVKIATVVNFPSGDMAVSDVIAQTVQAIADGADEIDLVIPYRALLAGEEEPVKAMVGAIRSVCTDRILLKAILETGELRDRALIRNAAHLAISAEADFIKTSTGKVPVNATLESADIMLTAIRESGRDVGFKAAGGVRTVEDAAAYLDLAETVMGRGWPTPSTFRFGASGLLDDIRAKLHDTSPATPSESAY
ncbi:deoxyribose-phosphate aldolase [Pararhizobium haloflavum]|uniref:deoxyribose-phosphate aldolase n=1 Tax=Pararhizobium haloflavum TaxID=2037914 RepID=UPI000C198B4F|nr:deoxyribose-phosphate aldolase [Pararhizobium haloflavum]